VALLFVDSCDLYATADITEKWTAMTASTQVSAGTGRRGTSSLRCGAGGTVTKTLPPQATWVLGFAWRCTQQPASTSRICAVQLTGATQVDVRMQPGGTLIVTRNGTVLGSASVQALSEGVFYYLELRVVIHPSTGSYVLRVDGVPWLSGGPVNTQGAGTASANMIVLGHFSDGIFLNVDVDDIYICDGTGSANTQLLGDCRVDALLPSGDGAHAGWTPSAGTSHFSLVDEVPPNDDTDYLSASVATTRESHTFTNLPAMPTPVIYGVQHTVVARKDDAGTRQVYSLVKSGAITQVASTPFTMALAWTMYTAIWEQDPATTAPWTVAGVNAMEAGVENA
jgi:hypothetical protein